MISTVDISGLTMYEACLLHARSERALKGLVSRQLRDWNLSRMEWLLLATAAEPSKHQDGHTMGQIAEVLDIRLSQLTALATRMNTEGYVSQIVSSTDRRTKYLKLTPRGYNLIDRIEASMRSAIRDWLDVVPREDLSVYLSVVAKLAKD